MHAQNSCSAPTERLEIAYTDKPVSGWGGMVTLVRFFDRLGLRELLRRALPDGRTSPNQIPVVDIVLAFLTSVLTGGSRFAHVDRLRADTVVAAILGIRRMPSAMTVTRYFGGFVRSQVEHLSEVLWHLTRSRLGSSELGSVLDLDSTVFERYGQQEGSLKGHNPKKHGRPSHHPIFAMLAEAKVVVHAWLRSGNTGTARGVCAFLAETIARLRDGFRLYALRADSGFFVTEFLDDLEARRLPYAIAVRMTPHVKRSVIAVKNWTRFAPGLECSEMNYQAPGWSAPRRMVLIREELLERPDAKGRRLIDVPGYTFHAVVTTLPQSPIEAWRFYNHRAECENRFKELKEDYLIRSFCLQSFDGTQAVFLLICFLFNLVAEFKREVTRDESPRLGTLRAQVFVVGAILGAEGRKPVLRLGLKGEVQQRFATLLDRVAAVVPTVAQFVVSVADECRPWRPGHHYRGRPRRPRLHRALN